jgi:hypothetical protein
VIIMPAEAYPVRVEASLDPRLSRWLWLVKWFLAIPHYIVLAFLWVTFVFLSIAAFFAILFTGSYPRSIFEFNVGVLRWTWRVQYYTYGALGTDRYPPFTLAEVPGYPAHLEIEYPARLSRGLVLVKWWLLAIPQYIIAGLFAGGGTWAAWRLGSQNANWAGGGLIGILVLVAAIMLAVTGRYPQPIFDFVLGMNRWVLRVAAYAALMTDKYPPFRLDMGGSEPDGRLSVLPPGPGGSTVSPPSPRGEEDQTGPQAQALVPPLPAAATGWTPGRIVSVVIGSVLALASVGLITGGAGLLWAGQTQRHNGYLTSATTTYSTSGYALATAAIGLHSDGWDWVGTVVGKVRIRVTAPDQTRPVFVGIAPTTAAASYLSGVRYTTVTSLDGNGSAAVSHPGTAPSATPQAARIWTAQASGTGTQTLTWTARSGDWMIVVMNRDAAAGVTVRADAGATIPVLPWIVAGLLAAGILLAAGSVLLILLPVRRART